jgi:hypothetical protein
LGGERKVKSQKRETHQERICNFHKQQVVIRERPLRGGCQNATLRSVSMPSLQTVTGKREFGGGLTLHKMVGKEDGGRCWTLVGWSLKLVSYACCFSLAFLSEVAMFALFQSFSTFQHSRLFDIYMARERCLSFGYFLLARGGVGVC